VASGAFSRILKGYLGILKGVGFLLALLAASAAVGFAASYPLWLFSTSARAAYSWFVLAAAAAAVVFFSVRAAIRRKARPGASRPRRTALSILLGVVWVLCLAAGVYVVVLLAARGLYLAAVPALAGLLLLLGWLAFGRRAKH
jgi:hypothetical protein